ncbi:hypothetical protein AD953_05815, partial [Acetobacter malorum]
QSRVLRSLHLLKTYHSEFPKGLLGAPLKDDRGQLRSYFNAAPTVKMGVITDGMVYEFYADSDEPNMMDPNAFLSFDLHDIAKGKIEDSVVDGLKSLQKSNFDPENIGAEAKRKLVFQNLVQQIEEWLKIPANLLSVCFYKTLV